MFAKFFEGRKDDEETFGNIDIFIINVWYDWNSTGKYN
jgi:hypothetical protein